MQDILVLLQLKPHNCFIGAVIVFPFFYLLCQLEFTSFDEERSGRFCYCSWGAYLNTFMVLTFGESSSHLSLDMNMDRCT